MTKSAPTQHSDSSEPNPKIQPRHRRDFVAIVISTSVHALLLLLLALWIFPSLADGGKQLLKVSFNEGDSLTLDTMSFPVLAELPNVAETPIDTPVRVDDFVETTPMDIGLLEITVPQTTTSEVAVSVTATSLQESLASSGSVEGAVDRITGELDAKLDKGDLLVVWLLDASNSLVDDRKRVAARLTPFYDKLVAERSSSQHVLQSTVVSFGKAMRERVAPTEFGKKIVSAVERLPVDRSGKEQVFESVGKCAEHYRKDWPSIQIVVVIWTDESGDDLHNLEPAITACRQHKVSVSVVGPSSVLGADTGLHAYTDPKSKAVYQLPVLRGPDTAIPERVELGYWFLTRHRGMGRGALPTWLGGQDLQGILSGYSPYALTRLAMQTGGQYTIFDRPEDRGPFDAEAMRQYAPEYGSFEEYQHSIQSHPLRRAVLSAVDELKGKKIDAPPLMLFTKKTGARFFDFMRYYYTPNEFQAKLRSSSTRLKTQATRSARVVEAALAHVSAEGDHEIGLDDLYLNEQSFRWRAWYDLTRGRLLATSIRLEEYRLTIDAISKAGVLASTTNHVMLVASPNLRSDEHFKRRSDESVKLLERCVYENRGTPWETLAQRELEFALGVGVRELALTFQPSGPASRQPNLPRF